MTLKKTAGAGIWLPVTAAVLAFIIGAGFYRSLGAAEDKSYESLKLFTKVLEEIEANYVDDIDTDELVRNAIKGMLGNLDPHSSFLPAEAFEKLQDDTKGKFNGIGIVITMKDGILTVISPIEGTPAYEAGVKAGDVIIAIDGDSTRDMALWEAVKKMRGPKGEEVEITVLRKGKPDPLKFVIERDTIPMESVRSATIKPGYGYLRVTNFRKQTAREIETALADLEGDTGALKGLILDLRHNPGGLLDQAVEVSDIFLEKGAIVSVKGRPDDNTETFNAHPDEKERRYPIVVLINGGSASAAEIVAGALQDHDRAVVLGTTSFGKGSVQTVKPLRQGGIKYTIARYYTPSGRSIQAKGIVPDIVVEEGEVVEEEETEEVPFDRMLKERDLKNYLKPDKKEKDASERKKRKTEPEKGTSLVDIEKLKKDVQVKRALDMLISYGVFSKLHG